MISVNRLNAMENSGNESIRDERGLGFFSVTEKSPQSICLFESDVGRRERREERSTSAPARICARMLWATCGGSVAMAFDGTGIGVAVKSEYCGFAWRREL